MEQVTNFTSWWSANKDRYERIGVNEVVAKSIWDACADLMADMFKDVISKTLEQQ